MEKKISTIIFDFGNVLIGLDTPAFSENFRELTGIHTSEEQNQLQEVLSSYERGLISTELFINQIISRSPKPLQAREIIQCWNSILVGISSETLDLLKKLNGPYQTFILSNTNPLHIEWVHHHLKKVHSIEDLEKEYLQEAFYSHDLKLAKPDPEIYTCVQSRINVPPDEILFLDDLKENVSAAIDAGWNAVLHPAGKSLPDTLGEHIHIPQ